MATSVTVSSWRGSASLSSSSAPSCMCACARGSERNPFHARQSRIDLSFKSPIPTGEPVRGRDSATAVILLRLYCCASYSGSVMHPCPRAKCFSYPPFHLLAKKLKEDCCNSIAHHKSTKRRVFLCPESDLSGSTGWETQGLPNSSQVISINAYLLCFLVRTSAPE